MKECFLRFLNCANSTKLRKASRMVQILLISAKKLKALQPFEMPCAKNVTMTLFLSTALSANFYYVK